MIDTIITIELEHRARQKALTLKAKIDAMEEMSKICGAMKMVKEDLTTEYDSITADILDFTKEKEKIETFFVKGLITHSEAENLIEHEAFATFFE